MHPHILGQFPNGLYMAPNSDAPGRPGQAFDAAMALVASLEEEIAMLRAALVKLAAEHPASPESTGAALPPFAPCRSSRVNQQVSLYYFGQFKVMIGDLLLLRRAGKGRAILQYLASKPSQPVPRDVLIEVLWGESQLEVGMNRLRVAMHHLRQAFASSELGAENKDLILFHDGCYLINPRYQVWTDIGAFEEYWDKALHLERQGKMDQAVSCLLDAEALYRGDFLEEEQLEDWTIARREELKDIYLTILEKLSNHWLQAGDDDGAIEYWKKILAKNPWREDIYRKLMARLAARGQRANALHWYDLCVHALREHLDVDPEPETLNLHRHIRDGVATS